MVNWENMWRIKAVLLMKRFYPLTEMDRKSIELYRNGVSHYENQLRLMVRFP
jgi:hypothetical protein